MIRQFSRGLALLLPVVALAACSAPIVVEEQRSLSFDHWSGQSLDVQTANGRIEVECASRTDVLIEARIVAGGVSHEEAEQRLAASTVTASRGADGTLVVRTDFPLPQTNRDSASLRIVVPDAASVVAQTSNGRVSISGVAGPVRAKTSNGTVEVTGVGGPVDLETSNGAVRVRDASGGATVSTSNGSVVAINAGWPLSVRTSNGSITVESAGGGAGTLEATTSNGSITYDGSRMSPIRSESARGRLLLVFDEAGPRSTLRSSNGRIRVRLGDAMGSGTSASSWSDGDED